MGEELHGYAPGVYLAEGVGPDRVENCAVCRFSVLRPWQQGMGETLAQYREREDAERRTLRLHGREPADVGSPSDRRCARRSPQDLGYWPRVAADDWCGEFEARRAEAGAR